MNDSKPTTGHRQPAKIMVTDDNGANLRAQQAVFEAEGFSVALAQSGEEALAQVQSDPPDVVLLDVKMPGMDGMETLKRLKAMAPDLPVVMVTSYAEIQTSIEAIKQGAEDFLLRPIGNERLV